MVRAADPVALYFREEAPFVDALERQDTRIVNGILCSMHGDIGLAGTHTRGMKEFLKLSHRVTLGHNHSSTIRDMVWRVGTSTPLIQHYVEGPATNWTNTHQVIFENGQRQNINFIYGKWRRQARKPRILKAPKALVA